MLGSASQVEHWPVLTALLCSARSVPGGKHFHLQLHSKLRLTPAQSWISGRASRSSDHFVQMRYLAIHTGSMSSAVASLKS